MYNIDELKKQIISLDFSKLQEIENLNANELLKYVTSKIEIIKKEINQELFLTTGSEIKNIDEYFINEKPINFTSIKLPHLIPTFLLLNRIKNDLELI
jgi:hypothetical protein